MQVTYATEVNFIKHCNTTFKAFCICFKWFCRFYCRYQVCSCVGAGGNIFYWKPEGWQWSIPPTRGQNEVAPRRGSSEAQGHWSSDSAVQLWCWGSRRVLPCLTVPAIHRPPALGLEETLWVIPISGQRWVIDTFQLGKAYIYIKIKIYCTSHRTLARIVSE